MELFLGKKTLNMNQVEHSVDGVVSSNHTHIPVEDTKRERGWCNGEVRPNNRHIRQTGLSTYPLFSTVLFRHIALCASFFHETASFTSTFIHTYPPSSSHTPHHMPLHPWNGPKNLAFQHQLIWFIFHQIAFKSFSMPIFLLSICLSHYIPYLPLIHICYH